MLLNCTAPLKLENHRCIYTIHAPLSELGSVDAPASINRTKFAPFRKLHGCGDGHGNRGQRKTNKNIHFKL